jgi:hypothetical protein
MLNQGTRVRHRKDRTLGIGRIDLVQEAVATFFVSWPAKPGSLQGHTESELEPVLDIVERLAPSKVGQATFAPFVLRLLGRWFESRHALTGELSNQPFQMLPHQVIVTTRW